MFQLQHIWILGKGMQKAQEGQRDEEILQMWQSRTPGKGLQVRTKDEDQEEPRRLRWRRQWQEGGFCWRFGVGIIQWTFVHNNSQNWYVILNRWNNKARELNMHTNVKTKNGKEL